MIKFRVKMVLPLCKNQQWLARSKRNVKDKKLTLLKKTPGRDKISLVPPSVKSIVINTR